MSTSLLQLGVCKLQTMTDETNRLRVPSTSGCSGSTLVHTMQMKMLLPCAFYTNTFLGVKRSSLKTTSADVYNVHRRAGLMTS